MRFNEHLVYYGPTYQLLAINTGRDLIYVLGNDADTKYLRHLVKNISRHDTVRTIEAFDYNALTWWLERGELRENLHVLDVIADCNKPKKKKGKKKIDKVHGR